MSVSSKCKVNVNQCKYFDVKPTKFDSIPLRTYVPKYCVYYHIPASRKCKSQHITLDRYDQAKILRAMYLHKTQKETPTYYYLDTKLGKVRKLKEVAGDTLDYKLVFHGTKSQAIKRLEKLL